jgi:hypothetical protein
VWKLLLAHLKEPCSFSFLGFGDYDGYPSPRVHPGRGRVDHSHGRLTWSIFCQKWNITESKSSASKDRHSPSLDTELIGRPDVRSKHQYLFIRTTGPDAIKKSAEALGQGASGPAIRYSRAVHQLRDVGGNRMAYLEFSLTHATARSKPSCQCLYIHLFGEFFISCR